MENVETLEKIERPSTCAIGDARETQDVDSHLATSMC